MTFESHAPYDSSLSICIPADSAVGVSRPVRWSPCCRGWQRLRGLRSDSRMWPGIPVPPPTLWVEFPVQRVGWSQRPACIPGSPAPAAGRRRCWKEERRVAEQMDTVWSSQADCCCRRRRRVVVGPAAGSRGSCCKRSSGLSPWQGILAATSAQVASWKPEKLD